MLKIYDRCLTDNVAVNYFLKSFMNKALKRAVKGFIECYENKDDEVYFPGIVYREDLLIRLFPKNYPDRAEDVLVRELKKLYSLLDSDQERVPTKRLQFVLAQILRACVDIYVDEQADVEMFGEENFDEFEEKMLAAMTKKDRNAFLRQKAEWKRKNKTHDYSVNFPFSKEMHTLISEAYTDIYIDSACDPLQSKESAEKMTNSLWHFSDEWFEFCFECDDYTMYYNFDKSDFVAEDLCGIT